MVGWFVRSDPKRRCALFEDGLEAIPKTKPSQAKTQHSVLDIGTHREFIMLRERKRIEIKEKEIMILHKNREREREKFRGKFNVVCTRL